MKTNWHIFLFVLLVILSFSCSVERHSVFHAVITDRAEVDSNLDNDLTIVGLASDGTDYYVAVAGALWKRPVSGNASDTPVQWDPVTLPDDARYCTAFTGDGTNLYVGFMLSDNTFALYEGSYAADPGWTAVVDVDVAGKQITRLFSTGPAPTVFAATMESDATYALYYLNTGDYIATGMTGLEEPVTSVIWDGTEYWAVTADEIYHENTAVIATTLATPPGKGAADKYQAIFHSGGVYFVSLNNGYVYSSSDGGATWPNDSGQKLSSSDRKIAFTDIAAIDGNILVGTLNNGFYQTKSGDITELEKHEDELVSDINSGSVLSFYVDGPEQVVFFLTGGYGLYRNSYTAADGWGALTHE